MTSLHTSHIKSLPLLHKGKVRDIYDIDDGHMLIVTTDRLSAFDVVLPTAIPGKGSILNDVTQFWLQKLQHIVPNHSSSLRLDDVLVDAAEREEVADHAMIVRKLKALPVEAIVRGYVIGSGWKDYQTNGSICGISLPAGLKQAERLPEPIYTPSTKAAVGAHDENISYTQTVELLGEELAAKVRDTSIELYRQAAEHALERGIIIADTKFEFGVDEDGELTLIDEVLTPDSSRFWPVDEYQIDTSPVSFDKQFVRDYLETLDWNKTDPGPQLPDEIVMKTAQKYEQARDLLMQ